MELEVRDQSVKLRPEDVEVTTHPRAGYSLSEMDGILVGISTVLTDELAKEGLARDLIRRIQNQRKEADFNISDEIEIYYDAGQRLTEAFETFEDYICAETLSASIHKGEPTNEAHLKRYDINGESLKVGIVRTGHSSTSN
jgi:isoleucyl-tRNA synthetase